MSELPIRQVVVGGLFEKYGAAFSFLLFNQIHVEFALYVDTIIDNPTTLCEEDLDYSKLIHSIKDGLFMNCYGMSFNTRTPKEERPGNGKCQLNADNDANANKKKKVTNTNSGKQSDVNLARLCAARSSLLLQDFMAQLSMAVVCAINGFIKESVMTSVDGSVHTSRWMVLIWCKSKITNRNWKLKHRIVVTETMVCESGRYTGHD